MLVQRSYVLTVAFICVAALLCAAAAAPTRAAEPSLLKAENLRCEFRVDPLGIDVPRPRLSWNLTSPRRAQRQTAYQVLVASSAGPLARGAGDLWDSGKVASDRAVHVAYAGTPLASAQQCFWSLRVWDGDDRPSAWSPPASWTMGLLSQDDWQAKWITADGAVPADKAGHTSTLLRRELRAKPGLRRALVFVCGLGQYELTVNGRKSGNDLLAPGWTGYRKTCLYDTHDVTAMLREGENALGLILGNGMYNVVGGRYAKYTGSMGPQKAIAHVRLEYADGSHEIVGTDERWQVTTGPITFSCVFGGEDHDARLEASGWDAAGFNASAWSPARPCDGPGGALKGTAHAAPPIRAFDVLKPVAQRELKPGVTVYDLGQNASIMPRLAVTGPAGAIVRVTPSELVRADGSIDRRSCGNKPAFWQYTLRGSGGGDASGGSAGGGGAGGGGGSAGGGGGARETWFPKFFYHGSRYLQVECLGPDGKPLPMDVSIEGVVVHSSAEPVGDFACSSDLFNRTRELVRWAQRSNIVSIITDCPHRERLGWLEQYHLNGPSLRYEWGLAPLYTKGLGDMADAQTPDGLVPDIAPEFTVFRGGFRDSPEWGSAVVIAAWQQYLFEGDADLLRRHYGAMTRYVDYLSRKAKDNLLNHGLGDWYDLGPNKPGASQLTPIMLTATATYYQDLATMAQVADVLGKLDDAASYRERAADVRRAFNAKLFDAGKGRYATGSQTAQAMPLFLDLVEPQNRQAVIDALVRDIRDRGNALTAGDVGHYYLLRALAGAGRSDVVFDMHSAADKPGYGLILSRGATSLTEAWDAGETSSQNHFMLGHIVEWFYRDLAGIQPTAGGPGFARITIRPQVVGDLTSAKARYRSIRGPIESAWKRDGERLTLEVSVPPGSTATVHVPTIDPAGVTEGGGPADKAEGVRRAGEAGGAAVFDVQSGRYTFAARFDATRAGATTGAGAKVDRSR